jgi:hypothetical protein
LKTTRFGNVVFIAAAIFFGLLLIYSLARGVPNDYTFATRALLSILLILSAISLKLPSKPKVNLSLAVIATGFTLLAVEVVLGLSEDTGGGVAQANLEAARRENVPFDTRTLIQVIEDLRSTGVDAYPMAFRAAFGERRLEINGRDVFALGGISNTPTISCNELGDYVIYPSDEHGFNNPPGIWAQDSIDIISIGDSFTYGQCVKPEENFTSLIRREYRNSLNLGLPATGPLDQLAIMKEYIGELKPKAVLWFYWEGNDLFDLRQEKELFHVANYLETDYRQGLASLQPEIDNGLRSLVNREITKQEQGRWGGRSLLERVTLRNIRDRLQRLKSDIGSCELGDDPLTLFERVLTDGKKFTASWGGDLYFVYLPTWTRYADTNGPGHQCPKLMSFHGQVISTAERVGLPVIDVMEAFDEHPDPLSLFPFRVPGHYNEEGYKLVADTVLQSGVLTSRPGSGQ